MVANNPLSELAKRQVAFSGRADIGNVPELYALRRAMQGTGQADMGGTQGLASGTGGTTPADAGGGFGGGGPVTGRADIGLPGAGLYDRDLEVDYTRLLRQMEATGGEAPDRGQIAARGQFNIDPADPFGVGFGQNLATATQVASLLGVPTMGIANQFVNLMLQDAQARNDAFFDSLIEGTAPIQAGSGVTIERGGPTIGPAEVIGQGAVRGDVGADLAEGLATGDIDVATDSGISFGRGGAGEGGGDAGSGAGADSGGGGMGCFVAGTKVQMADGSEKNIELIQLGDMVMGFSEGEDPEPCEVIGRFAHRNKHVWRLNGDTMCTPGHRFFASIHEDKWGFWPLEEIPIGATILGGDGEKREVERIEDAGEHRDVFNITVQRLHTYIADGYRVHNIKHMGGYISEDRVPGQTRGDVAETLQEGEYVITADAVDMLGQEFFDQINKLARMAGSR